MRSPLLRKSLVTAAAVAAGALTALSIVPAHAAEYSSALKIRGVQYDAPGRDSNSCSSGDSDQEYLTVKNYSPRSTINLKGYVVRDATGNRFTFTANHHLQPGDYVKLRDGHGTDSDTHNVVYRNNCNFLWNNDKDTIYPYKPSGGRADVHTYTYTHRNDDPDGNGYINFHI
ncbi:lamin tail domain-containing protein [Streptomyces sp. NPDC085932]|uniref:lamin tail domain-containing protein n=1 Tax=Streptomyces sp. NPDC085932 TaxID=3365741 RepID=UPI0037CE30C4